MIDCAKQFIDLVDKGTIESLQKSKSEFISDDVCYEIINHYPDYILNLVTNKKLSLPVLRKLAQSKSWRIRFWVAMKRKLDYELFKKLSQDRDEAVRRNIAYNAKTPLEILQTMYPDIVDDINEKIIERIKNKNK